MNESGIPKGLDQSSLLSKAETLLETAERLDAKMPQKEMIVKTLGSVREKLERNGHSPIELKMCGDTLKIMDATIGLAGHLIPLTPHRPRRV